MSVYCESCVKFTLEVPEEEKGKALLFKEGTHGYCRGAVMHPAHIEHKESIRCIFWIEAIREES